MSIDVDVSARICALLEAGQARQDRVFRARQLLAAQVHQVSLTAPQMFTTASAGGSGTIDYADNLKAKTGYYWSIRRLTLVGWTAGSATVSIDGMEPVAPYSVPAVFTFGKGELLLHPDSRLTVAGTGITGNVQLWGAADVFPAELLPYYTGVAELSTGI